MKFVTSHCKFSWAYKFRVFSKICRTSSVTGTSSCLISETIIKFAQMSYTFFEARRGSLVRGNKF